MPATASRAQQETMNFESGLIFTKRKFTAPPLDFLLSNLSFSDVAAHRQSAVQFFPAATFPKFTSADIVSCHQKIHAFESGPFQSGQAFIDQASRDSAPMICRVHCEMINVTATAIMTA